MASKATISAEMATACLLMRSRLVSRVITGIYDDVLRPFGIKGTQLNLLAALAYAGTIRRSEISRVLKLDSSTLTRNLRVMETNGWIEDIDAGADGRGSPVRVTDAGHALLRRAFPAWKGAQRDAARLLGGDGKAVLARLAQELPFSID